MVTFYGKVIRVIDGDTLVISTELTQKLLNVYQRFDIVYRLLEVDTPELNSRIPEEVVKAKQAKAFLTLAAANEDVIMHVKSIDPYKRPLAKIVVKKNAININDLIIQNGYGIKVAMSMQLSNPKPLLTTSQSF